MSFYKLNNEEGIQIHEFYSDEIGVGIGVFSDIIEKLEVDGGIRIAVASDDAIEGTIQYKDGNFQGYGTLGWVRLDAGIEYFVDGEGLSINTGNILSLELSDNSLSKDYNGLKVEPSNISLDAIGLPINPLDLNNQQIINLADPVLGSDAVNKDYVDSNLQRSGSKEAARLATETNVNFNAAPNIIDGIYVQTDDRILVKNQTEARYNGIYVVQAPGSGIDGIWIRSSDMDGSPGNEIYGGDNVFVTSGNTSAGTGWLVVGDGLRIPDVNNINWSKYTAGLSVLSEDQNLIPTSNSSGLDYNTGITLPSDVAASSHILITVNGKVEDISYGDFTGVFYFSINGGISARDKSTLTAGDYLWFSPTNAAYELETTDNIAFVYTS